MARNTNIKLRRSATAGAIPTTSNLDLGELALNTNDGKLYMKTTEGSLDSVIQVGSATDSYFKIRKTVNQDFTVTVASKTTDHVYHGSGSSSGYIINGIESPHLNLVPGNSYQFDQSDGSNSGHPLRFYYDAAKTTAYTAGVTTNGTAGSSGAYTKIVPTKDTPMVLYYQCTAHGYMGGSVSFATRNLTGFDTDELGEGSSNLYYTNARARGAISVTDVSGDGSLAYNNSTGVITYTGPSAAEVRAHLSAGTGMTFSGGAFATTITQYTNALARAAISVTDSGGDGSLAYNNSTGVITYTGPSLSEVQTHIDNSASNVRAHLSAGTGVTYSGGQISIGQAVATNSNVQFNNVQVDGTLTSDDITSTNIAATGNLTVSGNLTVQGTTTTVNSTTLDVVDKNLTLNYHASNDTSGNANGAGITIQDAVNASTDATILWDATNDEFDFSHPVNITGRVVATGISQFADVNIPDNNAIRFGNSQDLQIFHDGNNSIIKDNGDGHVQVLSGTFTVGNASLSKTSAVFNSGGSQDFYHNNNKKLETTNTGVKTTGTVNVNNAYTLPTSDGSSGQVLQTDGSGTLSFATVSSGGGGTVSEAFKNIAVSGQTNIVADAATDTLTFAAGSNITLTTTPGTDTLTIASSGGEVTVQEEGSSLSTAATTLNFVGAGVTASGSGATKTITIPGGSGASQSALYKEYVFTPGSNTSNFYGSDANGDTLSYTVGYISVYLNGVLLKPTTDYTATSGTSVVLVNTAVSGDVIQIATFVQIVGTGDSSLSELSGDGSTTAFTIAANPNHENNTQVYIDGIYQEKATYSISGTTLTFSTAPPSGSSIEVVIGSRNVTVDDVQGLTVSNGLTTDTITASGAGSITGNLDIASSLRHIGDTDTELLFSTNDIKLKAGGATHFHAASDQTTTLYSGNSATMTLDTSQRVGIGTNSPSSILHISDASSPEIRLEDSDATSTFNITTFQNTAGSLNLNTRQNDGTFVSTDYQIGKNASGANIHKWFIGGSEKLRLDASGRLGIGTASPGVSLDVGSLTDAIRVPNGTTGQRPTAALGQLRYNTSTSEFEGYADGAWGKIGGGGDSFGTIAVSGQTNIVAEQENDTLTIVGAGGITATTTAGTDTLTLTGQTSVNPFTTDFFTTANNSTTAFTLSVTPPSEDNLIVFLEGVYQNKNSYALSGTTLTLDAAPASGTEVVVHIIQNGVVGAGHVVDEFTGNGSTAAYTLSVTPLNENNTFVYLDGVYQEKSTYSVSGNTLTFGANVTSGHSIEIVTPQVSQVNQPAVASIDNVNMFSGLQASEITSVTLNSASQQTLLTHSASTYRSVKYNVQITQGSNYHTTEINVLHNGTTAYITEYGTIFSGSSLATFDATISSGNLLLQITMGSASSATIKVVSTAIPV